MSLTANPFVPKDGAIVCTDATATPLSFTCPYEEGNFQWDELSYQQKTVEHFFARGRYFASRETVDKIMGFSWDAYSVGFTDAADTTISNVVMRSGATWNVGKSTLPTSAGGCGTSTTHGIWAITVKWTGERTELGGTADSTLTMKYCHLKHGFGEGNGAKFGIKGEMIPYSTDYLSFT